MTTLQNSRYFIASILLTLSLAGCGGSSNSIPDHATLVVSMTQSDALTKAGGATRSQAVSAGQNETVPSDIQTLIIEVRDSREAIVKSASTSSLTGVMRLNVIPNENLLVSVRAINGQDTLYQGSTSVEALSPNESRAVSLPLNKTFTVAIGSSAVIIDINESASLTGTVSGLSNNTVGYAVNGITGGNPTLGIVDIEGVYTPSSGFLSNTTVTLSAFPINLPSLSADVQISVLVDAVWDQFNWDDGKKWQ
ncbi:MAG: hypothetical protein COB04_17890 [Gammaproteobacteria bacterium]|nr:MAG: hypothetical protein COB04_17890 [Gammaproteobacteria bacterium]